MKKQLSQQEQQKLIDAAQQRAFIRMQPLAGGGAISCEFSDCTCLIKKQITVKTMSVIVTPELDVQLVCQGAAEKFIMDQYINTERKN